MDTQTFARFGLSLLTAICFSNSALAAVGPCGIILSNTSDCTGQSATITVTNLGTGQVKITVTWGGTGACGTQSIIVSDTDGGTYTFHCGTCDIDTRPCNSGIWGGITTCSDICTAAY